MQTAPPPEIFFGFGLAAVLIFGLMFLACLALMIFWIWAIIDVANHEKTDNDRLIWLLVVILLHWIGALIYLLVRRPERIRLYGQ